MLNAFEWYNHLGFTTTDGLIFYIFQKHFADGDMNGRVPNHLSAYS